MTAPARAQTVACAALALALAFAWQFLTVRYNYAGNWSGFFCTGSTVAQPPALASEKIYTPSIEGYDGQFYHYVAHDPFFRQDFANYIDAPRLRYRRILVPGLAWLLALGKARFVDAALFAVNLAFLFAGVYWLGRYATLSGGFAATGLLFLLVPAVIVSLDRLTVDLALTALSVAFALYVTENRTWKLYMVLALAALARETGLLLTAAYVIDQLLHRRFLRAEIVATSALPALAWYAFVQAHTSSYRMRAWFTPIPLGGLIDRMLHPVPYPFSPVATLAMALDFLALAGMLLAFLIAFWIPRTKWLRPLQLAIVLIAASGLNLGKPFWAEAYAFGRVFSPLLLLVALYTRFSRPWLTLLPLILIVPRIGLQIGGQTVKIVQGLFGHSGIP